MKALQCEMCGSQDLVKDGGVFICQSCGTKYSVEEAKKMMVEGTVDVKGTVKVDTSDELKNLYEIARRAKDSDNSENAAKYYDMILVKDPSSWEANFYVVYYKAMSCTIAQIASAGNSISNCLPSVFDLIDSSVPEIQKEVVLKEIQSRCSIIAHMLSNAAEHRFYDLDLQDFSDDIFSSTIIVHLFADILEERYNGEYSQMSVMSWKESIEIIQIYTSHFSPGEHLSDIQKIIDETGDKIKKYDSSYIGPKFDVEEKDTNDFTISNNTQSNGCYIASAVYGSYDCPEVWTLRRFRDFTLDETWYGRLFIKFYYATSPTFVKYYGNDKAFKAFGKRLLDKMVAKLNRRGFDNTPYKDKY